LISRWESASRSGELRRVYISFSTAYVFAATAIAPLTGACLLLYAAFSADRLRSRGSYPAPVAPPLAASSVAADAGNERRRGPSPSDGTAASRNTVASHIHVRRCQRLLGSLRIRWWGRGEVRTRAHAGA